MKNSPTLASADRRRPQWSQYTTVASSGAALAVAMSGEKAAANVVVTQVEPDVTLNPGSYLYLDLDHSGGAGPYASSSLIPGADFALYFCGPGAPAVDIVGTFQTGGPNPFILRQSGSSFADRLLTGNQVGPSTNFNLGFHYLAQNGNLGPWAGSHTEGYLGLAIVSGSNTNYGWAHLIVETQAPTAPPMQGGESLSAAQAFIGQITLLDFEYETTANTPIAVPEVNRPLLLALGLGGAAVRQFRRRRAPKNSSAPVC